MTANKEGGYKVLRHATMNPSHIKREGRENAQARNTAQKRKVAGKRNERREKQIDQDRRWCSEAMRREGSLTKRGTR